MLGAGVFTCCWKADKTNAKTCKRSKLHQWCFLIECDKARMDPGYTSTGCTLTLTFRAYVSYIDFRTKNCGKNQSPPINMTETMQKYSNNQGTSRTTAMISNSLLKRPEETQDRVRSSCWTVTAKWYKTALNYPSPASLKPWHKHFTGTTCTITHNIIKPSEVSLGNYSVHSWSIIGVYCDIPLNTSVTCDLQSHATNWASRGTLSLSTGEQISSCVCVLMHSRITSSISLSPGLTLTF